MMLSLGDLTLQACAFTLITMNVRNLTQPCVCVRVDVVRYACIGVCHVLELAAILIKEKRKSNGNRRTIHQQTNFIQD